MRYILACMLLIGAGYSQETAEDSPAEITTPDEGGSNGEVAINDSYVNWGCGCGKKGR